MSFSVERVKGIEPRAQPGRAERHEDSQPGRAERHEDSQPGRAERHEDSRVRSAMWANWSG